MYKNMHDDDYIIAYWSAQPIKLEANLEIHLF